MYRIVVVKFGGKKVLSDKVGVSSYGKEKGYWVFEICDKEWK